MTKFSDMVYERPDLDAISADARQIIADFTAAESAEQQVELIRQFDRLSRRIETLYSLASVRNTIDTRDEFYDREQTFFDENMPRIRQIEVEFGRALVTAKFRPQLEEVFGKQIFDLTEVQLKTFAPEVMDDLAEENRLCTEYSKLTASAQIEFEGKTYTLSQLSPLMQSPDRDLRRRANEAYYGFFAANEDKLDEIYDRMVQLRTQIAHKLGYQNFVQLAYDRMGRTDYQAEDVAQYRAQVQREIVPLATRLHERHRERLGLDRLLYYDEPLKYENGNAVPQGDPDWILAQAERMYRELSAETDEFFQFMRHNELLDVLSKPGKAVGGYCTEFADYKAPFIFANFNGTQHDVEVMTHEAGHAFQGYQSREMPLLQYTFPTMEACEIHSMSMEFFTWPWMELFFKEQTDKFKFTHLSGALEFIPYGVTVDEFQHWVYENPTATPAERKLKWRELERKYQPHREYDQFDYLERGGFWMRQLHIFTSPFYYIDYTLAQVCALQFWIKNERDHETAWQDYLHLCQAGGSKPFLELLHVARLDNPFVDGCIAAVVPAVRKYLDGIDDRKL